MLQELEGFTYATALDLNQAWATKPLDWILTRPESVPSTFHGASTPISDYRWILQVLLIYDIFKNENVRANENLGEVRRRLINKISSYQGKPQ